MNFVLGEIILVGFSEYSFISYRIIIEVIDNGELIRKSSQVQVIVNINDINNNVLDISINVFLEFDYVIIIENVNIGDIVVYVEVDDVDNGINGYVFCYIIGNFYFKFQFMQFVLNEFKVVVNGILDREDIIEYNVIVFCEDGGILVLNSIESFRV